MPKGYFDAAGERLTSDFRAALLADRREERMAGFPEALAGDAAEDLAFRRDHYLSQLAALHGVPKSGDLETGSGDSRS